MSWAIWLAVPIGATAAAAVWAWWRGWRARRALRRLPTEAAVRAHSAYLDALVVPVRNLSRPPAPVSGDDAGVVGRSTLPG